MSKTFRDGGIGGKNKYYRKIEHKSQRMLERNFCKQFLLNSEVSEKRDIAPQEPVYSSYWCGYWKPLYRWLESNVGQNWNEVYSRLLTKVRSFMGQKKGYISINNYIRYVVNFREDCSQSINYNPFYVDESGLLQKRIKTSRRQYYSQFKSKSSNNEVCNWLNGRIIGYQGDKLYWFVPVSKSKKYGHCHYSGSPVFKCEWGINYYGPYNNGLNYSYLHYNIIKDNDTGEIIDRVPVWKQIGYFTKYISSRQDKPLSNEDIEIWNGLNTYQQDQILDWSPTNLQSRRYKKN